MMPQREENVQPLMIMGWPTEVVAKGDIAKVMEETGVENIAEGEGVQQITRKKINPHGHVDIPTIQVLEGRERDFY